MWTFYLSFFLHSIGYSLGVSHLTVSQLDDLQRAMVSVTLQKMNYSSKFPRAVVFGPPRFGGLDFRDLKVEQGVDQIHLLLRNLRTPDCQAGHMALITLEVLQFTAGTGYALLEYPQQPLPHLDGFWVKSLRSFLASIDGQITIAGLTIPSLQREFDMYIMDFVLECGAFNDDDTQVINACRLYLEVITVSDIATVDGAYLQQEIYGGQRSYAHSISRCNEPRQDRPSDASWVKWRRLLRLLAHSDRRLHRPLGRWLVSNQKLRRTWVHLVSPDASALYRWTGIAYDVHPSTRPHVFSPQPIRCDSICPDGIPVSCEEICDGFRIPMQFPRVVPSPDSTIIHATFQEFIDSQPDHISSLLQHWEIIAGDVYSAFADITDLSDIAMVTDGGAADEYGSFGWVIGRISTQERIARGKGITFGHDPRSYRAENFGGKASHWFLQLCFRFMNRPLPSGALHFYCDNQGLIKKQLFVRSYANAIARTTLHSEWDLIVANYELLARYPTPPIIQHVHGHQDDRPDVSSVTELPFAVQLNIEADELSSEALETLGTPFPRVPFDPLTRAQLTIGGYTVTRRIETTIRTRANLLKLKAYYNERFHWVEGCFETIDWDAFSQGSQRQKKKRKFITKLSFNQLPTGGRLHRRDPKYDDRCPSCHCENETDDHLFQCPDRLRCLWRKDFFLYLDHLFRDQLDPILFRILCHGFRLYFNADSADMNWQEYPPSYKLLIRAQNDVGWDHLIRGKFVRDWHELQDKYSRAAPMSPSNRPSSSWLSSMISVIFEKGHALWKLRCDARHGNDRASAARAELDQVERQLRQLYSLRENVQIEDRDCFYADVDTHLQMPLRSIKNWLQVHEPLIRYSVRAAERDLQRTTPAIDTIFPPRNPSSPLRRSRLAHRHARQQQLPPRPKSHRTARLSEYFDLSINNHPRPLHRTRTRTRTPSLTRTIQRKLSDLWPDHPS